jgi:hypothetical protein
MFLLKAKSTKRARSQATQARGTNIAVGGIPESIRASAAKWFLVPYTAQTDAMLRWPQLGPNACLKR